MINIRAKKVSVKQNRVAEMVRRAIIDGKYPLGGRLPTRTELARRFKVSVNTAQWALQDLEADGFVKAGARGTYVSTRPPYLSRYGLVLPHFESGAKGARLQQFCHLVYLEMMRLQRETGLDVVVYEGLSGGTPADAPRLRADVAASRLAGVISTIPWQLEAHGVASLCRTTGVPMVGFTSRNVVQDLVGVEPSHAELIARGLDDLKGRGHVRIAVLAEGDREDMVRSFTDEIDKRGMETRPYWILTARMDDASAVRCLLHLLTQAREQPDALLIMDDTLVEPATAGLKDGGLRIPESLEVLAHCNFPYPTPSHFTIRRFGFDIRDIVRTCLDDIDRRRRGEKVAGTVPVPVVFDTDVR